MTLTEICSWCKKILKQGDAPVGAPVTHGCCRACAKKYFPLYYDEISGTIQFPEEE